MSNKDTDQDQAGAMRALGLSTGWAVFSYLIAGMLAYGIIGWLVGRATHIAILFPVGMLVGLAISLGYVIHHYGRAEAREAQKARAAQQAGETQTQKAQGKGAGR
jgi:ATP synthase protein I